jgi:penicillin amidase
MRNFPLRRVFLTSLLSLCVLAVAAWFGGRWWLAESLLPLDGKVALTGLDAEVEILFDDRGIPRIYATTDADALHALGWLHASERLFQMELLRRVAAGEISSIVGPAGIESDILHRRYGFARRIELDPPQLDPDTEALIQAYVDGINTRIESEQPLPPAFVLLDINAEPWTLSDVLIIAHYQTWYPTTLVQRLAEAWRDAARAHGAVGADWLQSLPQWGLPTIPPGWNAPRMTEASNTWVVAPSRSASGAALHASDPHLDYSRAPGLWYAAGLHTRQTLNVVGVTAPGLPLVSMGHNGRIAFAFTVAPVDLYEVYRFGRDPLDATRWLGPEGPFELVERVEVIDVRGAERPIEHRLKLSPWGPAVEIDPQTLEVLHWAGFDLPLDRLIENGIALNRAGDFDAFRAAASDFGALSVNWSYSDIDGNIGYVQSTPIPLRRHERFYTTLDGADPINHWAGFVPPDQRPWTLNPAQGWLANANNHAAIDAPWPMPGFYKHLRMRRAADWLERDRVFDAELMHTMQMDYRSERALAWKDWLAGIAADSGRVELAEELRAWDGVMAADSLTAGLFTLWWQFLPVHLFGDAELDDWRYGRTLLDDWMQQPPPDFELAGSTREAAARAALDDALRTGRRPLGHIQTLTIEHPLARSGLLDRWLGLRRGPIPIGGGPGSLNVTYHAFDEARVRLEARAGASMRFVMDWSDPDAFTLNLTLGQSGHPLSPHFDDQLGDFLEGRPRTVPFSRTAVERAASSRLLLQPID